MIYPANELDLLEASSLPDRQPILSVHLVLSSAPGIVRYHINCTTAGMQV